MTKLERLRGRIEDVDARIDDLRWVMARLPDTSSLVVAASEFLTQLIAIRDTYHENLARAEVAGACMRRRLDVSTLDGAGREQVLVVEDDDEPACELSAEIRRSVAR